MDNAQLMAIVFALVLVFALAVIAYAQATRKSEIAELLTVVQPLVTAVIAQADVRLAAYGPALAPVHALVETGYGLIDQDDDEWVKVINNPKVIAAMRAAFKELALLTDGEVSEAIPPVEVLAGN